MKHLTKILTLLLAFLMVMTVISPLAACDKTPEQSPDTTACDTDPVTDAPATEVPAETEGKEGGCKSSVAAGAAVLTAAAVAVAPKKKGD